MRITRDRSERTIYLDKEEYIATILVKYGMTEASSTKTPITEGCKLTKVLFQPCFTLITLLAYQQCYKLELDQT